MKVELFCVSNHLEGEKFGNNITYRTILKHKVRDVLLRA